MSIEQLKSIYAIIKANFSYMKVNLCERKLFLGQFYSQLQDAIQEATDISYSIHKVKIAKLKTLIPSNFISDLPHFEPDVAHVLGYSPEVVLDMVSRGSDAQSVVTGFPVLSRYIYEGEFDAVSRLMELNYNLLFVCDKLLQLPLSHVSEEGVTMILLYNMYLSTYSMIVY